MAAALGWLLLLSSGFPAVSAQKFGLADEVPEERLKNALQAPNATGSFHLEGYDLTQPLFNATRLPTLSGWTVSINVTGNISLDGLSPGAYGYNPHDVATGAGISIRAPTALTSSFGTNTTVLGNASEWKVVATTIIPQDRHWQTQSLGTNVSSCTSIFTSDCIVDLKGAAALATSKNSNRSLSIPGSCIDAVGSLVYTPKLELDLQSFNGSTFFFMDLGDPVSIGNTTLQYDQMVRNIYPVLVTWSSRTSPSGGGIVPPVDLICISATDIVPGSRIPSLSMKASGNTGLRWTLTILLGCILLL